MAHREHLTCGSELLFIGRTTMNGREKDQIHENFYNVYIRRVGEGARSGEANRTSSIEL